MEDIPCYPMATSIIGSAPPTLLHLRYSCSQQGFLLPCIAQDRWRKRAVSTVCCTRCPTFMHRHMVGQRVLSSLRLASVQRRRFTSLHVQCSAATVESPPKPSKGSSDKDKRITPKSTDFSRWWSVATSRHHKPETVGSKFVSHQCTLCAGGTWMW